MSCLSAVSSNAIENITSALHRNKVGAAFGSIALIATVTIAYFTRKLCTQIGLEHLKEALSKAPSFSGKLQTLWVACEVSLDPNIDIKKGYFPKDKFGRTPLFRAIQSGQLGRVQAFIRLGALSEHAENRECYLHRAAQYGNLPIVQELLSAGLSLAKTDENNLTPLHCVAFGPDTGKPAPFLQDYPGVAQALANALENASEQERIDALTAKDNTGLTPLALAVSRGQKETVEILIEAGSNAGATSNNKETLYHLIVDCFFNNGEHDDYYKILDIINGHDIDINAKNTQGQTALHLAAKIGKVRLVKKLLEFGAKPNISDTESITPLHNAIKNGSKDVIEALLDAGAYINANANGKGGTPLHVAVAECNVEATKLLVDNGANVNSQDSNHETPLHKATEPEIVELLLKAATEAKVDIKKLVNIEDNDHRGPLYYANNPEVVRALLDAGAEPYSASMRAQPLERAITLENRELAEELVKAYYDAGVNFYTNNGLKEGSKTYYQLIEEHFGEDKAKSLLGL